MEADWPGGMQITLLHATSTIETQKKPRSYILIRQQSISGSALALSIQWGD